jgi:hypothetical protein
MNDPGLDEAIGEYAEHIEGDRKFEQQLETENEQTFLNPRCELKMPGGRMRNEMDVIERVG